MDLPSRQLKYGLFVKEAGLEKEDGFLNILLQNGGAYLKRGMGLREELRVTSSLELKEIGKWTLLCFFCFFFCFEDCVVVLQ